MSTLTLVTGASSNHLKSLCQLLQSILRHEPDAPLIIYDLGLTDSELKQIRLLLKEHKNFTIQIFNYRSYPAHCNIAREAGHYAWKPIIVADTMNRVRGSIFWLDAGCKVEKKLHQIREHLQRHGLYSPISQGKIVDWTHEGTLRMLGVTHEVKQMANRSGGVVAVNWNILRAREIIQRWKSLAFLKSVIAPYGSSRKNHRQDQSILSILINQALQRNYIRPFPNHYLGISVHNDCD